jgi:alpha-ribazole phosphatase
MSAAILTTIVDLLRHGETEGGPGFRGSTDDPLTPRGLAQMWAAVDGQPGWDRIVTSPMRRCAEFSAALARHRKLPLDGDERLKEIHFGAWEAKTAEQLMRSDRDALLRFWSDPALHTPPGGEPLAALHARAVAAWAHHLRTHSGQRLLFVTHGGPIRVVLGHVLGSSPAELLRFDVAHASLTRIRVDHDMERGLRAEVLAPSGRMRA